ncbi:MAG TPA: SUMF1/EgtB/PvdO family nonheme iron enzyme [Bacteroidales bacterium]|nr:SUMF1/EgtB/PvdO family nonheme iron enzyme [Bacteroidales bacterium]
MRGTIYVVLLLLGFEMQAQNISVASFERRDNDMDARVNYPVKDQNGDVCALLKIETTQTGFVFEGGSLGIMKTERKTGEYWVYIPWGSKRITIKHDQLGILRDYTFPESIEKATVYLMKLTTGKVTVVVEEPEILTQWVVITSTPDGAQVYVDDKPVGNTPFSREYSLGQHNYRVELPMYHAEAGVFTLDGVSDKVRVTAVLKPNFGSINVSSSPESSADVLLDGKPTGQKTPCTLTDVSSGPHRITIKKNMYYDAWQEVTVDDSKTAIASLTMNPAYGELIIHTQPAADIYVDDIKVGFDSCIIRRSSGFYTVTAKKESYSDDSKKFEISDGIKTTINLSPIAKYGVVKVSTTPPDAIIVINGENMGTSPITIRQLLIGTYDLELRKSGFATIYKQILVNKDQVLEINETLSTGKQVRFISEPIGAFIEINNEPVGKTPYTTILNYNDYVIKVSLDTLIYIDTITVNLGGNSFWQINLIDSVCNTDPSKDYFFEGYGQLNIELALVEGGTFNMGSPSSELNRNQDEVLHSVFVNEFYISRHEITFEQYDVFCTSTGRKKPLDNDWGRQNRPVINVTWNDANDFCIWLTKNTGRKYRLPTEAEWEYACRAESESEFYFGSCLSSDEANYNANFPYMNCIAGKYLFKTNPVGSYRPNKLNLFDMHGNVKEWCSDWFGEYSLTNLSNPQGPQDGTFKVNRGGSWYDHARYCRSACRNAKRLDSYDNNLGFRIVYSD